MKREIKESENYGHTGSFTIDAIHYASGKPVSITVSGGMIERVEERRAGADAESLSFIAPGLIDNQVNGFAGVDFSGDGLTGQGVLKAVSEIWKEGVTTLVPTLITNSHENLLANFKILGKSVADNAMMRLSIPGFHLEGPYISAENGYRGCHPAEFVRKPSTSEFDQYQRASGGRIIQVTLAPEAEGAPEFIRSCTASGIVVSIGHTNADTGQIKMAADNGARLSTHLGNGCANMIHRHYNPLWPQLADDRLTPSIIADGHHLLPEEIKVIYKVKGPHNMILTSDVIYLSGMDPGKYTFLGTEVVLTPEGMLLDPVQNCLAGASFPITRGIGNIMKFTGCTLKEAIDMASSNVASIYGLSDRGMISPGKRADLILFDVDDYLIRIRRTWLNGIPVWQDDGGSKSIM